VELATKLYSVPANITVIIHNHNQKNLKSCITGWQLSMRLVKVMLSREGQTSVCLSAMKCNIRRH